MTSGNGDDPILREKHKWFRGTARVELRHLQLDGSQRCIDWRNVARLVRVFEDVGCDRLAPEHHVPVLVSERDLEVALHDAGVSLAHLLQPFHPDPPRLRFSDELKLVCLHGQHRLLAADRFLPLKDRWWAIDIYTPDLSGAAQTQMREQYSHSQEYNDGEKFRHICYYRRIKDLESERRWTSMLSRFKQASLKAIQNDNLLFQALESLLPYPGIWKDFNFSLFHRLRSWRCREEVGRYLEAIYLCWDEATDNDPGLRPSIDTFTTERLQRLMPRHSRRDQERVRTLFAYGEIFPSVSAEPDRSRILQAVLSLQHRILSFRTLAEDSKYLNPIKDGIHSLVSLRQDESMEAGMRRIHLPTAQATVQVSENEFRPLRAAPCDLPWLGYLQLVLFCIRNFNNSHPRGNRRGPRRITPGSRQRPLPTPTDAHVIVSETWDRLATLAHRLGFSSSNVDDDTTRQDGEEQIFPQSCSEESQALDRQNLEEHSQERAQGPLKIQKDDEQWWSRISIPAMSTDFVAGTPKLSSQLTASESTPEPRDEAGAYFYLPIIFQTPQQPARYITTPFGELREIFCAFFGRDLGLPWQRLQETATTPPEDTMFLPVRQSQLGQYFDDLHETATYQAQDSPSLDHVRRFSFPQAQELQDAQRTQDPADSYRFIVEDAYKALEGHRRTESDVSWESLDDLEMTNLIPILQRLNRECIDSGKVAFWKLEERLYFTIEKDSQLIRRLARRIKSKEIGGVATRQLIGVVTNDRFKYCVPNALPAPVGEKDPEGLANIIFLLDAPSGDRCSTWNMVLDGQLFSQNSLLALGSDLAASSSAKRPRSLTSSVYPDSQGEKRDFQRRRIY